MFLKAPFIWTFGLFACLSRHLLNCVIMASIIPDQSCGLESLYKGQCTAWLKKKNHREMLNVFKLFFLEFQQLRPAVQTPILTGIVGPTFFFPT